MDHYDTKKWKVSIRNELYEPATASLKTDIDNPGAICGIIHRLSGSYSKPLFGEDIRVNQDHSLVLADKNPAISPDEIRKVWKESYRVTPRSSERNVHSFRENRRSRSLIESPPSDKEKCTCRQYHHKKRSRSSSRSSSKSRNYKKSYPGSSLDRRIIFRSRDSLQHRSPETIRSVRRKSSSDEQIAGPSSWSSRRHQSLGTSRKSNDNNT